MTETESASQNLNAPQAVKKSGFAGDVLKLVSGTTLAQALTLLAAPVFTRIFPPDAYGTAAVFTSVTSIIGVIACLRYEFAITLPEKDEQAANVLALALAAVLAVTAGTGLLIFSLSPWILRWLNAPDLGLYLWMVPLSVLAGGGFLAFNYWNTRTRHFSRLSLARVAGAVMIILIQFLMVLLGQINAGGMITASLAGSAIVTIVLGLQIWRDDRMTFLLNIRWRRMLDSLVRYRKFPLVDSWGSLLNSLSWQLPPLMLSAFFSLTSVGYYSLAYRLIQLPMSLIGASISQVFYQRASASRSDREALIGIVKSVFERLVALALLPYILLTLVGPELFVFVFGSNWLESGKYVQILSLWVFFWFISSPLSTLFNILERQELTLIVHIAILLTRLGSLWIGGLMNSPYLALGLFSGTGILVYGGLSFWNMRLVGIPFRYMFWTILKYGFYSLPAVILLLVLKFVLGSPPWLILAACAVALAIYFVWIAQRDETLRSYSLRLLRRFSPLRNLR